MSQRDVLAELRTAHVEAPRDLRTRVRLIAAQAPVAKRSRRRFAFVLAPVVVAAVAAGAFFLIRPAHHQTTVAGGAAVAKAFLPTLRSRAVPAPSPSRAQRYSASLQLQVKDVQATVTKALRVAASLGGFPASVHIDTSKEHGSAFLLLRVPRVHVQAAVARLGKLGLVSGEQVDIQDLQAGINTNDRTIAQLQRQVKALLAQGAPKQKVDAVVARIVALQRQRVATLRAAHFATVQLSLSTPPVKATTHHHYLRNALPWLGGAAAALILLLALRGLGRVREDRLLSRL